MNEDTIAQNRASLINIMAWLKSMRPYREGWVSRF